MFAGAASLVGLVFVFCVLTCGVCGDCGGWWLEWCHPYLLRAGAIELFYQFLQNGDLYIQREAARALRIFCQCNECGTRLRFCVRCSPGDCEC